MDYKKFEENVYKYIIEYNKGSTKSITRVKKAKETLNITILMLFCLSDIE